jgi:hypothetical protein
MTAHAEGPILAHYRLEFHAEPFGVVSFEGAVTEAAGLLRHGGMEMG